MATAEQILSLARKELGYKESPANSNRTKYGKWYQLDGNPWCMMFVMWVFNQADAMDLLPVRTASCGAFLTAAKQAGNWHSASELQPGDVVIFDFPGNKSSADHVGIVEKLSDNPAYVFTLEGNTSTSNDSNGGMVMRRKRKRTLIRGGFRPAYETTETPTAEPEAEEAPEPEETFQTEEKALSELVGNPANFKGSSQFSNPYDDAEAVPAVACAATVEAHCPGTTHPFRLYGEGISGWADEADVEVTAVEEVSVKTVSVLSDGSTFRVKVTAKPALNVRSAPGEDYALLEELPTNTLVTIVEARHDWGRLSDGGWIALQYTERL